MISIDLLGFGESPAPTSATYTLEEHVASVERTLRSLGFGASHPRGSFAGFIDSCSLRSTKPVATLAPDPGVTADLFAR